MDLNKLMLVLLVILAVVVASSPVLALELPTSLQNLQSQNEQNTQRFVATITFFVAFLAGIISFVSPCILPVFPAFFAYAFTKKRDLKKATLAFSAGMIVVMVAIGLLAAYVGRLLLDEYRATIVFYLGFLFIGLGMVIALGRTFGVASQRKIKIDSLWSIAGFGALFGIGFTPCIGPIFGGILAIAMVLGDYLWSGLLFAFYAIGISFPLYFLSVYYDKWELHKRPWMRGKTFTINLGKKRIETHSHNLLSGGILIFFGSLFVLHNGTFLFNALSGGYLSHLWFMYNDALLQGSPAWYWASLVVFVLAILFVAKSLKSSGGRHYSKSR
ncbi:cytochrome c biogenesis protein CcdA [Candidatus Woesearchaeota archaeon]|nr:cytochrome c biogenesis protein CcdA [Candidatus Woesearchaeota archaeon]